MDVSHVDVVLDSSDIQYNQGSTNYPRFILNPDIQDCVGVSLVSAVIPFSYNVIDGTNNQFLVLKNGATPSPFVANFYLCTIKPGTYNSINIIPELQSALANAVSTTGSVLDISSYFSIWVDTTNSLLTFYAPQVSAANIDFRIQFDYTVPNGYTLTNTETRTSINSVARILGFIQNDGFVDAATTALFDNSETKYTTGTYVTSDFSIRLTGEDVVYIHSNLASNVFGYVRNSTPSTDIIAAVSVNNNYQGSIEYSNPFPQRIPFSKKNIGNDAITFYITLGNRTSFKADGTTLTDYLDMKGLGYTLILRFYQINSSSESYGVGSNGNLYTSSSSQVSTTKQPQTKRMRPNMIVTRGPM